MVVKIIIDQLGTLTNRLSIKIDYFSKHNMAGHCSALFQKIYRINTYDYVTGTCHSHNIYMKRK